MDRETLKIISSYDFLPSLHDSHIATTFELTEKLTNLFSITLATTASVE
jgi:hypothetical protein